MLMTVTQAIGEGLGRGGGVLGRGGGGVCRGGRRQVEGGVPTSRSLRTATLLCMFMWDKHLCAARKGVCESQQAADYKMKHTNSRYEALATASMLPACCPVQLMLILLSRGCRCVPSA